MATKILDQYFIGTVMKLDKTKRQVGVYIPKLMAAMYDGDATDYKYPTNSGLDIGDVTKNISSTVKKTNYTWVKPFNADYQLPEIGSKVLVLFIDNSPLLAYWIPFNYNGSYEIIEEERYPRIHDLTINNITKPVKELGNLSINLPSYFSITTDEDKSEISYNLIENYQFYKKNNIENAISNLQKSVEYLERDKKKTFITGITNINLFPNPPAKSTGWFKATNETITKSNLINKINVEVDLTKYSLSDYRVIKDKLNYILAALTDDERKNYDYQVELEKFLTNYNKSVDEYVYDEFNNIKTTCIDKITTSENLLDCDNTFVYGSTLLNGLKDTYMLYTSYLSAYNTLSSVVKTSLKNIINDLNIKTNIRLAMSKALASTSNSNVDKYIKYVKNMFPESAIITYRFSTDGAEYNYVEKDTEKIFQTTASTDAVISFNGSSVDVTNPGIDMMPVVISTNTPIIKATYLPVKWVDEDNVDIFSSYYLIKSFTATPKFMGQYITYNEQDDSIIYNVLNDENLTYSITVNGVAKTIAEVNTILASKPTTAQTIKLLFNSKELTITINNNTTETVSLLITLINNLSGTSSDNVYDRYQTIVDGEGMYALLDSTNKALVINYSTLTSARSTYDTKYATDYKSIIDGVTSTYDNNYDYVELANKFNAMNKAQQQAVDATHSTKVDYVGTHSGIPIVRIP